LLPISMTVVVQDDDEVVNVLGLWAHLAKDNTCACVACSDDDDDAMSVG
jgi:hypothetical protein